jgi:hypothetical protein
VKDVCEVSTGCVEPACGSERVLLAGFHDVEVERRVGVGASEEVVLLGMPRALITGAVHGHRRVGAVLPMVAHLENSPGRRQRRDPRALPRRVRTNERCQRREIDLRVTDAPEVLDLDAADHAQIVAASGGEAVCKHGERVRLEDAFAGESGSV